MTEDNQWDTMPWVEEQLVNMGITPPAEPQYPCPVIEPGTLTTISSQQYTETYEKLLGWFGYMGEKTAYAKSMVLQCENEMKYIEVMTKKVLSDAGNKGPDGKKLTSDAITLRVESDPRYLELMLISQKWRQLRDGLKGRLDTIEENLKVISRQIEIRKLDQGGAQRQGNMPYRGRT